MSEVELSQRSRTGIMLTHNQLSHLTQQLSTNNNNNNMKNNNSDIRNSRHTMAYTVEVNSRYFSPSSSTLHIPVTDADGLETVPLSLTFETLDPGTYSCDLLLKSAADVRRHRVVVLVLAAGSAADPIIEFCSSLHQPITQNIPLINSTSVDWLMMSELSGLGFSGPKELCVKRHSVSQYPLKFSPKRQGYVEGRLVLRNAMDDVEYRYNLRGRGEKCPAVDTLSFTAQVNQCLTQSIPVQNITDKRVLFKVETDLAFLVGNESLVVLSHQTGCYDLSLTPPRRGRHQGVLAFIATEPNKDYDSDSEYLSDTTTSRETQVSSTLEGFRVWYHIDLYAEPSDPVSVLDLAGPCQKQVSLNLPIQNPTEESVTFEVTTEGHGLCGPRRLVVGPNATENCLLLFSPTVVGDFVGSVVFYHTVVGEFWYCIRLTAESPYLTVMPVLEAELGRGCMQDIELNNATSEALVLHPHVTNPVHFTLLLSEVQTMTGVVEVNPSETVCVPVVFTPSELGTGDHSGSIIFSSAQLGNMEYRVCGKGLLPITCDRLDVRAMVGTNASATINFTNPTDVPIIITAALREMSTSGYWSSKREQPAGSIQSPFQVLLKRASQGLCLEARERVQIPISFTPTSMCCYETRCELTARRQDGQDWIETVNNQCAVGSDSYVCNKYPSVIWSYVLRGYAEGQTPNLEPLTPLTFSARTNCRLEERLDLLLTGSEGGARCEEGGGGWVDCVGRVMKRRPASPVQRPQVEEQQQEQEEPREEEEEAERYEYYIEYGSESTREALEACYALQLIGQGRDERTSLTMLTYSVIYSPTKLMTCDVTLVVQRCGGGVDGLWRYPLQFYCTEIEPNCVIDIQSAALNTVSCLSLTVRNQTDTCEQYTAQFVGSSDTALFTVTPQTGTLPPCSSEEGLALTISYCPNMYGRRHRVRLLIQTETAQWTYDVRGVLPVYVPPHYHSAPNSVTSISRQTSSNCGSSVNHVISNLRLSATAASSPFKRQPLLSRRKTCPAIHLEKSSG